MNSTLWKYQIYKQQTWHNYNTKHASSRCGYHYHNAKPTDMFFLTKGDQKTSPFAFITEGSVHEVSGRVLLLSFHHHFPLVFPTLFLTMGKGALSEEALRTLSIGMEWKIWRYFPPVDLQSTCSLLKIKVSKSRKHDVSAAILCAAACVWLNEQSRHVWHKLVSIALWANHSSALHWLINLTVARGVQIRRSTSSE